MPHADIYADTRKVTRCSSYTCGASIVFARLVASDRVMPFNLPLEVIGTKERDGRQIETIDLAQNHFASCPDRQRFSRRDRR